MNTFQYQFVVQASLEKVWQFHDDPTALTKVMGFPVRAVVHHVDRPVQPGSRVLMTFWFGPIPVKWNVTVRERQAPSLFRDEQPAGEGPFKQWRHSHRFEAIDAQHTRVLDEIEYEVPFGALGKALAAIFGKPAMTMMFMGRERATKRYLEA